MRTLRLLAVILAAAGAAAGAAGGGNDAGSPAGTAPAGTALAATDRVHFDLVLRLREQALRRYLDGLYDPSSPLYGHYLHPADIGRRFGLSTAALEALRARLGAKGIRVLAGYPQRTALRVSATAAVVQRVFGVRLEQRAGASGPARHWPDRPPAVPASLRPFLAGVSGLDTRPYAELAYLPDGALRPADATGAYDVAPLQGKAAGTVDGHGQTIAVLSIDRFNPQHVETYASTFKLHSPKVKTVSISKPDFSTEDEGDLDIDVIRSIAPKAQVIDYQLAFVDLPTAINRIVARGNISMVSASFGGCDATKLDQAYGAHIIPQGFRQNVENALSVAAMKGVSFFIASGDSGAYECQRAHPSDSNLTVSFPADAPYAVAVGGTDLSVGDDGSYQGETAWGDLLTNGGSGGGLNPFDDRLRWQASSARVPGVSNGKRQVPDVSAAAGDASPWWVMDGAGTSGWQPVNGTSAAAPFWAASMLLVQQYMKLHGAGPVCFAPPLLYAIGSTGWKFPPFHDVTTGTNRFYAAGTGWDFATGIGSPDVWNLATAAVVYRKQHPLPSGANACKSQAH
jgi:subtilase family serine protease